MKKIFNLIFGVLFILPMVVFADMSSPAIDEYEGEIINPKGATLYDYDYDNEKMVPVSKKLNYGDVVIVQDDYEEDFGDWIYIKIYKNEEEDEYDSYYVNRKDIVTKEKDYKINEKELSKVYDGIVIKKLEIKRGPANLYESTGITLDVGTKVKVREMVHYDEEDKKYYSDGSNPWIYIEYNGTKGFANIYGGVLAYGGSEEEVMTGFDVDLIDINTGKVITTIKGNTKFKTPYYWMDAWSGDTCYIKYGDKYGIVEYGIYVEDYEATFVVTEDVELYEEAGIDYDDENNPITSPIGTVKKGTTFKSKYYYLDNSDCAVRYENGKTTGWIISSWEDVDDFKKIELFPYSEDDEDSDDEDDDTTVVNPDEPGNNKPESVDVKPGSVSKPTDKTQLIYICIAAAVIVSLTSVVSIVLINKKKKQNIENVETNQTNESNLQ